MLFEDRTRAESFGADAAAYHAYRPSYPAGLVAELTADAPTTVLDVGCGTGIASALFAARGARVTGVEPDARMAAAARESGVDVELATFEDWDPAGRTFDLVISAQAWHWVEPVAGAAKAALALRPGGRIGLFWNFGRPSDRLREAFAVAYADEPGLESHSVLLGHQDRRLDVTAQTLREDGSFVDVERRTWRWTHAYDADAWVRQLFTHSDHAALPDDRRRALQERVHRAAEGLGGSVDLDYDAELVTARREG